MIHSSRFTCVLDTCVLYPVDIRDLLLWFAYFELYTPKWSYNIFRELKKVMVQKGMTIEQAERQIKRINDAFPDAMVINYQTLIKILKLPDPDDRHVLAAAIKSRADLIVTNNVRHFSKDYLKEFDLEVKKPDDFLTDIIDLNTETAKQAFSTMVSHRTNPELDELEMLDILRRRGLKNTADYLHRLI